MNPPVAARAQASTPSLHDRLKDPSLLRDRCYIDGAWVGTPSRPVTNPVNGVELAKVPALSTAEATQAVEAAERAFPAWAKLTAKQRSNILRKWFDLIIANREDLALILTSEQGKPLAEALGEVDIGGAYVEFFAEEARRVYGETIPTQRPDARLLAIKQPIGVCGAITPWNFPCSMITRKVSPALAAGCTVVLKPANETPLTALALVALAEKAGVPKGVFNILTGNSSAIGKVLCEHPAVRFVGFTGSTEVGKILYQQAAVGVKKLGLELGGNAPFVVFDDADIDAAVEGAMVSKYRNMGQTCVCANRLYAQDKIYDQFVEKLSKKVAAMKIGDGTEAGVVQGPLINMEAVDKVEKHIADAVKGGAKIVTGGKRHALGGSFFEPTVLSNVKPDALVAHEETFGPLAPVFRFKDEAEVIAMCNNSPFGLASYFYSRDLGRVWRVAEALESGMVGVNTGLITTEVAPFGGVKESGLGREGSHHGMEEYVEIKYVMMAGCSLTPCRPRESVFLVVTAFAGTTVRQSLASSQTRRDADAGGKARRARQRFARGDHLEPAAHFVGDGVLFLEVPLPQRRQPVGAQAVLREGRDLPASAIACAQASPLPTTRLASPMRSASCAPTGRPVRIRSIACEWPISRGRRMVPRSISGTPKRRQKMPKVASSATTRISAHSASSMPPATAKPSTAAITGFDSRSRLGPIGAIESWPPSSRFLLGSPAATALRSAPAQK